MEYSDEFRESLRNLSLAMSHAHSAIQQAVLPLANFASFYQEQMQETALMISKFSSDLNRQWSEQITPVLQQMIENNRLDTVFTLPDYFAQSIAGLPPKINKVVPFEEGESSLVSSITIRSKPQENKFTWRDAITIIGILLALLTYLNDLTGEDNTPEVIEVRQEINTEVEQTINHVVNNYYINFPEDQPSSSGDQP